MTPRGAAAADPASAARRHGGGAVASSSAASVSSSSSSDHGAPAAAADSERSASSWRRVSRSGTRHASVVPLSPPPVARRAAASASASGDRRSETSTGRQPSMKRFSQRAQRAGFERSCSSGSRPASTQRRKRFVSAEYGSARSTSSMSRCVGSSVSRTHSPRRGAAAARRPLVPPPLSLEGEASLLVDELDSRSRASNL
mmetsp:Transcript_10379/g.32888  ORF Transcript_10379/g.32888 Transcript_10379/m.32888 type:complete len:200 (-) Transcript_10379:202-801(-)